MKEKGNTMYKLPWSEEDNPNGWIEPTTACQLKCPGCYRGVDKEDHKHIHRDIEDLKVEVDWMISNRNIQTMSVAGGEPLLYPDLSKLIKYASSKNLRVMIYTNGIGLDRDKLIELKNNGVTTFLIHIDKYQNRTKTDSLDEILELRNSYCRLFRELGGINLGFIQPLSVSCMNDLNKVQDFFRNNRDIISLVVYTLYREICWNHEQKPVIDTSLKINAVLARLKESGTFLPASQLPATSGKEPAWVFSYSVGTARKIAGFLDAIVYELIQRRYYRKNGRFLFISRRNSIDTSGLIKLMRYRSVREIIKNLFIQKSLFKKNYLQTILVIRGPISDGTSWDLCSGCPDAMLYKGKLVPSCILEDIINRDNPDIEVKTNDV